MLKQGSVVSRAQNLGSVQKDECALGDGLSRVAHAWSVLIVHPVLLA